MAVQRFTTPLRSMIASILSLLCVCMYVMDMSVTDLEADEDISVEDANRKVWRGVDSMRKTLRNLHELTTERKRK